MDWLNRYQRFWSENLDRLAAFVEEDQWPPIKHCRRRRPRQPAKPHPQTSSQCARPAKVYAAWTDPEKIIALVRARASSRPARCGPRSMSRVGGRYRISFEASDGEYFEVGGVYREVVPNERLVFSWAWHSTPERESQVTVSLKPDGGGTLLTLHHEQFFDEAARDGHERGWNDTARQARSICSPEPHQSQEPPMQPHKIVSREEWIAARKAHLAHEKELTQRPRPPQRGAPRAALGQGRQGLCVRRPERQGDAGRPVRGPQPAHGAAFHVRAGLERGLQELLVLGRRFRAHDPASCRARHHAGRGLARAAGKSSRRSSSGWAGPSTGCSSGGGDFNYDFAVSFTPEEIKVGHDKIYNFGTSGFGIEDAPGISVFYRDDAGNIFHTYSCFARGLDMMNAAYHYLDLTPLGRHEEGLPYPMDWLRLRDQYQPAPVRHHAAIAERARARRPEACRCTEWESSANVLATRLKCERRPHRAGRPSPRRNISTTVAARKKNRGGGPKALV